MKNGLYSVRIRTPDGVNGLATGVVVLRDGILLGGDRISITPAHSSFKDGRIKGELVNCQHTPYRGKARLFYAGHEAGVGFSGTYQDDRAEFSGISLVGRRSVSIRFTLRKIADA